MPQISLVVNFTHPRSSYSKFYNRYWSREKIQGEESGPHINFLSTLSPSHSLKRCFSSLPSEKYSRPERSSFWVLWINLLLLQQQQQFKKNVKKRHFLSIMISEMRKWRWLTWLQSAVHQDSHNCLHNTQLFDNKQIYLLQRKAQLCLLTSVW